jgi:hypothetical protein
MSRKLNNLLKKGKLTGEEVGQLMIKDMIHMFNQVKENPEILNNDKEIKPLLTQAQKDSLVNGLDSNKDIRDYNNYRDLYNFLTDGSLRLDLYQSEIQISIWRLTHLLSLWKNAEMEYKFSRFSPTIMTQSQYKEAKDNAIKDLLNITTSVEDLIFYSIEYYIDLYLKGKRTPLNKHFNKAKKELITNPRIKREYPKIWGLGYYLLPDGRKSTDFEQEEWEEVLKEYPPYNELIEADTPEAEGMTQAEVILHNKKINKKYKDKSPIKWIDILEAPEDTNKFDVLESVDELYNTLHTDNNNSLWEFKEDYPDLYKDTINKLSSMKGLEFIKELPEEEYFNLDLIKWEDLINNNILDYKKFIEQPTIDGEYNIAVLTGDTHLNTSPPEWRFKFMAENLIEENKEIILSEYNIIINSITQAHIVRATFNIIGKFINIPVEQLLNPITFKDNINYLNFIISSTLEDLGRYDIYPNERPAEELKKELQELLIELDIDKYKPSKEAIKEAERRLGDCSIFEEGLSGVLALLWEVE